MSDLTDKSYAKQLDRQDALANFRSQFVVDDPDLIYLDGNSLGRLSLRTADHVQRVARDQWGRRLIRAWNEGWIDLPQRIGAKIAHLIGAQPDEVLVADSTSVNLFKLAVAALQAQLNRRQVITDDLNFPSDLYVLQGAVRTVAGDRILRVLPSPDGIHGPVEALAASIDDDTALVSLSHTAFKSAYTYDLAALTGLAHGHDALVLWDLSHSVGALPIDLNGSGADLAVGCTYKYLNGGPGAPAFLYVRRDLQDHLHNPISGWFGQDAPFEFDLDYRPAPGLRRFLTGTPPILSLAAAEPGVDLLLEAGIERVRAKSQRQTEYLLALWETVLAPHGFYLKSPRDPDRRGSHVSLGHAEALGIDLALIEEMQVLPDFRAPDTIRLGIAPLYTSYADLYEAVRRLEAVVVERRYERYARARPVVT